MFTIEHVPSQVKPRYDILALGADTRQRISWSQKGRICSLSPKKDFRSSAEFYCSAIRFLSKKFSLTPRVITFDPHPFFSCSAAAGELKKKYFPQAVLRPVFHHMAHAANFGIEVSPKKKFIGVTFDGTGFGPDRNVWGGEFFVYDRSQFRRMAHFKELALAGNEAAIKEPWRIAFAILYKIYGDKITKKNFTFLRMIRPQTLKLVAQMLDKNFNVAQTSSAGRLFDAASALLNIKSIVQKEGEAAIALEKTAANFEGKSQAFDFEISKKNDRLVIDLALAFKQMAEGLKQNKAMAELAYRFHVTMAEAVLKTCALLKKRYSVDAVYCSGGVFMNNILSKELKIRAARKKSEFYFAKRPMTTDLGISQGQIAACVMEKK